jgi:hypothetical protein
MESSIVTIGKNEIIEEKADGDPFQYFKMPERLLYRTDCLIVFPVIMW